jgi:hypothetical protein
MLSQELTKYILLQNPSQRNPLFNSNGCSPSASGRVSVGLKAEIGLKGRSSRERFRWGGHNSARFRNDRGEKFAAIRTKSVANGCSMPVDFSKKGFYFSYTLIYVIV